jgi:hypothetical protein
MALHLRWVDEQRFSEPASPRGCAQRDAQEVISGKTQVNTGVSKRFCLKTPAK